MQSDHDSELIRTWLPDASHYPEQMTPLSATVWFEAVGLGLHEAMRQLRGPFGGFLARAELGWAYEGELEPDWEVAPEAVRVAARDLEARWETEIEPRVHAITAELQRMRPELPGPEDAATLLDTMWDLVRQQWTYHFLTVIPSQFAIEMLRERHAELSGEDSLTAYEFMEGLKTERTEADGMLWDLALYSRDLGIEDIIREYPPSLIRGRLRQTHHGRLWLQSLDRYLLRFGGRSRWHELSLPREVEDPTMTLESVRLFLELESPPAFLSHTTAAAEAAVARYPELAEMLHVGSVGYRLKEDHTYHIDYPGLLATREVLLAFGRRLLADGRIEQLEDVWMLTRDELRSAVTDQNVVTLGELLRERREDLARGREEGPRRYLGEAPPPTERHAVLEQFYGGTGRESAGAVLQGIAASRGEAEGTARVVARSEDFRRVQPGDVLVTTTTTPAWTPLFASLAGLVTETGGVLSHAAVVAREYRLPAVVGVEGATNRIPDGVPVRVDGSHGRVSVSGR